jgi:hypothetical protein
MNTLKLFQLIVIPLAPVPSNLSSQLDCKMFCVFVPLRHICNEYTSVVDLNNLNPSNDELNGAELFELIYPKLFSTFDAAPKPAVVNSTICERPLKYW